MRSGRAFSGRGIYLFIDGISEKWILKLRKTGWETLTVLGMPLLFYSITFGIYDLITWTRNKWFRRHQIKYYYWKTPLYITKHFCNENWESHHSRLDTFVQIYPLFYSTSVKKNQNQQIFYALLILHMLLCPGETCLITTLFKRALSREHLVCLPTYFQTN